jgi:hypothetical protein
MYSLRRLALLLALASAVIPVLKAQSPAVHADTPVLLADTSSSSSNLDLDAQQTPADPQSQPPQAQPATSPQLSVQARIRARREQRRATALHEAYDHLYELYVGAGYLRFTPGPALQRVNEYDWNVGVTRYFNRRLGATVDGRGYYGTPFISPNLTGLTKPAISQYAVMGGPTYRFYLQPRYSISGRVLGGYSRGNFSGDTNGFGTALLGLYPDGSTFAASASIMGEYNLTPNVGLRVAPEYYVTGFGSTLQNNLGYTASIVVRFGKQ